MNTPNTLTKSPEKARTVQLRLPNRLKNKVAEAAIGTGLDEPEVIRLSMERGLEMLGRGDGKRKNA